MKNVAKDDSQIIVGESTRVIDNVQGADNVAYYCTDMTVMLETGDYIFLNVSNSTASNNVTLEETSQLIIY
jgi:hypothetical protein